MLTEEHLQRLHQLITTGADLHVRHPNGHTADHRPLAKMYRIDNDNPDIIWIRPIDGQRTTPDGDRVFSLNQMPPRSLHVTGTTRLDDTGLELTLWNEQIAHIHPTCSDENAETSTAFEHFLTHIAGKHVAAQLAELAEDSWWDDWA